ncbi:MAG: hypothetical protein H6757_04330 [Candidatus Omnitrophica bacterium]|nr:hypothetical protein [Candidatus Omnitrophota bacterium]
MKQKKIGLRLTAFFTALIFILSNHTVYALPGSIQLLSERPADIALNIPFQLSIPAELGTIQNLHTGSGPSIIHIQTAHGQYQIQKNIQKILKHLSKEYGIDLLLLEGSDGKLRSDILRFFPEDMDLTMDILDGLTRKALIKGPELFMAEENLSDVYGIEDREAYLSNGEAFKAVLSQREKTAAFLTDLSMQIGRLAGSYLNKNLRAFLKEKERFEGETLPFMDWTLYLVHMAQNHLKMDLSDPAHQLDWPMYYRLLKLRALEDRMQTAQFIEEREAFLKQLRKFSSQEDYRQIEKLLTSSVSESELPNPETGLLFEKMVSVLPSDFNFKAYPQTFLLIMHLILQSELDHRLLMKELSDLTSMIGDALAETGKEKYILQLLDQYGLMQKLFELKLLPEDYQKIKNTEALNPSALVKRFEEFNHQNRVQNIRFEHLHEIDELYARAMDFYSWAGQRDTLMLANIEKRLLKAGKQTAVVVTGGFHAGPFADYFRSRNYNYAMIVPKTESVEGREVYEHVVLEAFSRDALSSNWESPNLSQPGRPLDSLEVAPVVAAQAVAVMWNHGQPDRTGTVFDVRTAPDRRSAGVRFHPGQLFRRSLNFKTTPMRSPEGWRAGSALLHSEMRTDEEPVRSEIRPVTPEAKIATLTGASQAAVAGILNTRSKTGLTQAQANNLVRYFTERPGEAIAEVNDESGLFKDNTYFSLAERLQLLNLLIMRAKRAGANQITVDPWVDARQVRKDWDVLQVFLQKEKRGNLARLSTFDDSDTQKRNVNFISDFINTIASYSRFGIDDERTDFSKALADTLTDSHGITQFELNTELEETAGIARTVRHGIEDGSNQHLIQAQTIQEREIRSIIRLASQVKKFDHLIVFAAADNPARAVLEALVPEHQRKNITFIDNADPQYLQDAEAYIRSRTGSLKNVAVISTIQDTSQNILTHSAYQHFKRLILADGGKVDNQFFFVVNQKETLDHLYRQDVETAAAQKRVLTQTQETRFSFFTAAGLLPLAAAGVDIQKIVQGGRDYMETALPEKKKDLESSMLGDAAFLLPMLNHALAGKETDKRELILSATSEALEPFMRTVALHWLNPVLAGTSLSVSGATQPRENHFNLQDYQKGGNRFVIVDFVEEHPGHEELLIGPGANPSFRGRPYTDQNMAIRRGRARALEFGKRPTASVMIPHVDEQMMGLLVAQFQMMSEIFAQRFRQKKSDDAKADRIEPLRAKFQDELESSVTLASHEEPVIGTIESGHLSINFESAFQTPGLKERFYQLVPKLLSSMLTIMDERETEGAHDFLNSPRESLGELAEKSEDIEEFIEGADTFIVAGIGGSSVGAKAILDAVSGVFSQKKEGRKRPRIIFLEGVDPNMIFEQLADVDLKQARILYTSKSGETNEPNANFNTVRELYAQQGITGEAFAAYAQRITDPETGESHKEAEAIGETEHAHPQKIGGRFTAFTKVGYMPLLASGDVDVQAFLEAAASHVDRVFPSDKTAVKEAADELSQTLKALKQTKSDIDALQAILVEMNFETQNVAGIRDFVQAKREAVRGWKEQYDRTPAEEFKVRNTLLEDIAATTKYFDPFDSRFDETEDDQNFRNLRQKLLDDLSDADHANRQAKEKLPQLQQQAVEILKTNPAVLLGGMRYLMNHPSTKDEKNPDARSNNTIVLLSERLRGMAEWEIQRDNESIGKPSTDKFTTAVVGTAEAVSGFNAFAGSQTRFFTLVRQLLARPEEPVKAGFMNNTSLAEVDDAVHDALKQTLIERRQPVAADITLLPGDHAEAETALAEMMMMEMIATVVEAKNYAKVDYSDEPGVKEQKRRALHILEQIRAKERKSVKGKSQKTKKPLEGSIDLKEAAPGIDEGVERILESFVRDAALKIGDEIRYGNFGNPEEREANVKQLIVDALGQHADIGAIWFRDEDAPRPVSASGAYTVVITPVDNAEAIERRNVGVGTMIGIYKDVEYKINPKKHLTRENLEASMILFQGPGGATRFFGSLRERDHGIQKETVYDFSNDADGVFTGVESPKRSDIKPLIEIGYSGKTSGFFGRFIDWSRALINFYRKWVTKGPKNRYSNSVADVYEILLNSGLLVEAMTPLEAQLVGAIFEDSSGNGRSLVMTAEGPRSATSNDLSQYENPFSTNAQLIGHFGSQENIDWLEVDMALPRHDQEFGEQFWNQLGDLAQRIATAKKKTPAKRTASDKALIAAVPALVSTIKILGRKGIKDKTTPVLPGKISSVEDYMKLLVSDADYDQLVQDLQEAYEPGLSSAQVIAKLNTKYDGDFAGQYRHLGDANARLELKRRMRAAGWGREQSVLRNKVFTLIRRAHEKSSLAELVTDIQEALEPATVKQASTFKETLKSLKGYYRDNAVTVVNQGWKKPAPAKDKGISLRKVTEEHETVTDHLDQSYQRYRDEHAGELDDNEDEQFRQMKEIVRAFEMITIHENLPLFLDTGAGEYTSAVNTSADESSVADDLMHDHYLGVNTKYKVPFQAPKQYAQDPALKDIKRIHESGRRIISEENKEGEGVPKVTDGAIWNKENKENLFDIEIDPLDGSSKVATNGTVGAIITIYKKGTREIVAAGYVLFGAQTRFVFASKYDSSAYEYALTKEGKTPKHSPRFVKVGQARTLPPAGRKNGLYLALGGTRTKWDASSAQKLSAFIERTMSGSAGYSGSFVSDNLSNMETDVLDYEVGGGVYLYIAEKGGKKSGRLRPHETRPVAFLLERMGGYASTGYVDIMSVEPEEPQDVDPVIIGSYDIAKEYEDRMVNDAVDRVVADISGPPGREGAQRLHQMAPADLYEKAHQAASRIVTRANDLRLHPEEYENIAHRTVAFIQGQKRQEAIGEGETLIQFLNDERRTQVGPAKDKQYLIDIPLRYKNYYQARLRNRASSADLDDAQWNALMQDVRDGYVKVRFEADNGGNLTRINLLDDIDNEDFVQQLEDRKLAGTKSELRALTVDFEAPQVLISNLSNPESHSRFNDADRELLAFLPTEGNYAIGLKIGGTSISGKLFDSDGNVIAEAASVPSLDAKKGDEDYGHFLTRMAGEWTVPESEAEERLQEEVLGKLAGMYAGLIKQAQLEHADFQLSKLETLGLAYAGPLLGGGRGTLVHTQGENGTRDFDGTTSQHAPNLPFPKGLVISKEMQTRLAADGDIQNADGFDFASLVQVKGDGHAGLEGETSKFGTVPGAKNALYLIWGTGIGSALLAQGNLFPGTAQNQFLLNEIGHSVVYFPETGRYEWTSAWAKGEQHHESGQYFAAYQDIEDYMGGPVVAARNGVQSTKQLSDNLEVIEKEGFDFGRGIAAYLKGVRAQYGLDVVPGQVVIGSGLSHLNFGPDVQGKLLKAIQRGMIDELSRPQVTELGFIHGLRKTQGDLLAEVESAGDENAQQQKIAELNDTYGAWYVQNYLEAQKQKRQGFEADSAVGQINQRFSQINSFQRILEQKLSAIDDELAADRQTAAEADRAASDLGLEASAQADFDEAAKFSHQAVELSNLHLFAEAILSLQQAVQLVLKHHGMSEEAQSMVSLREAQRTLLALHNQLSFDERSRQNPDHDFGPAWFLRQNLTFGHPSLPVSEIPDLDDGVTDHVYTVMRRLNGKVVSIEIPKDHEDRELGIRFVLRKWDERKFGYQTAVLDHVDVGDIVLDPSHQEVLPVEQIFTAIGQALKAGQPAQTALEEAFRIMMTPKSELRADRRWVSQEIEQRQYNPPFKVMGYLTDEQVGEIEALFGQDNSPVQKALAYYKALHDEHLSVKRVVIQYAPDLRKTDVSVRPDGTLTVSLLEGWQDGDLQIGILSAFAQWLTIADLEAKGIYLDRMEEEGFRLSILSTHTVYDWQTGQARPSEDIPDMSATLHAIHERQNIRNLMRMGVSFDYILAHITAIMIENFSAQSEREPSYRFVPNLGIPYHEGGTVYESDMWLAALNVFLFVSVFNTEHDNPATRQWRQQKLADIWQDITTKFFPEHNPNHPLVQALPYIGPLVEMLGLDQFIYKAEVPDMDLLMNKFVEFYRLVGPIQPFAEVLRELNGDLLENVDWSSVPKDQILRISEFQENRTEYEVNFQLQPLRGTDAVGSVLETTNWSSHKPATGTYDRVQVVNLQVVQRSALRVAEARAIAPERSEVVRADVPVESILTSGFLRSVEVLRAGESLPARFFEQYSAQTLVNLLKALLKNDRVVYIKSGILPNAVRKDTMQAVDTSSIAAISTELFNRGATVLLPAELLLASSEETQTQFLSLILEGYQRSRRNPSGQHAKLVVAGDDGTLKRLLFSPQVFRSNPQVTSLVSQVVQIESLPESVIAPRLATREKNLAMALTERADYPNAAMLFVKAADVQRLSEPERLQFSMRLTWLLNITATLTKEQTQMLLTQLDMASGEVSPSRLLAESFVQDMMKHLATATAA